jgi:GABA(A) receptor-associated protein
MLVNTHKFKKEFSIDKRITESKRICEKYKDRIPIIVEVYDKDVNILKLDKKKYLVPFDLTVGQFMYVIRKRIHELKSDEALFLFFNNSLISNSSCLSSVYKTHKDIDGFLYGIISMESTFG